MVIQGGQGARGDDMRPNEMVSMLFDDEEAEKKCS